MTFHIYIHALKFLPNHTYINTHHLADRSVRFEVVLAFHYLGSYCSYYQY